MYTHMNTCSYDVVQLYCMQFNFMYTASVGHSFKLWLAIDFFYYAVGCICSIMSVTKDDKYLAFVLS